MIDEIFKDVAGAGEENLKKIQNALKLAREGGDAGAIEFYEEAEKDCKAYLEIAKGIADGRF